MLFINLYSSTSKSGAKLSTIDLLVSSIKGFKLFVKSSTNPPGLYIKSSIGSNSVLISATVSSILISCVSILLISLEYTSFR